MTISFTQVVTVLVVEESPETFTLAAGTYTTIAELVTAMGASIGSNHGEAFSVFVTPSNDSGSILLTMISTGAQENGNTITAGDTDVSASLGFTATPTLSPAALVESFGVTRPAHRFP